MSKNFRKEGQPEKERIARITGMDIDKVNPTDTSVMLVRELSLNPCRFKSGLKIAVRKIVSYKIGPWVEICLSATVVESPLLQTTVYQTHRRKIAVPAVCMVKRIW